MNVAANILAGLLAAFFLSLGAAKVLAVRRMRTAADEAGYSITAYRGIGILEMAGAAGLVVGMVVPALGTAATAGLLVLLAGALITHLRHGDEPSVLAPAVSSALLVAVYLGLHLASA